MLADSGLTRRSWRRVEARQRRHSIGCGMCSPDAPHVARRNFTGVDAVGLASLLAIRAVYTVSRLQKRGSGGRSRRARAWACWNTVGSLVTMNAVSDWPRRLTSLRVTLLRWLSRSEPTTEWGAPGQLPWTLTGWWLRRRAGTRPGWRCPTRNFSGTRGIAAQRLHSPTSQPPRRRASTLFQGQLSKSTEACSTTELPKTSKPLGELSELKAGALPGCATPRSRRG